jgi:uncharacterized protein YndB with AHSA1/START domain
MSTSSTRTDEDGTAWLRLDQHYPDGPEEVWAALTESGRLGRWFGTYTGTGRPGGTVELTVTGEVDAGGEVARPVTVTVHACEPPRLLVVDVPEGEEAWRVEVTLAPALDGGTAMRFEQRLLPGQDAADMAAGWRWYLDRLAASMTGTAMPQWEDYATGG